MIQPWLGNTSWRVWRRVAGERNVVVKGGDVGKQLLIFCFLDVAAEEERVGGVMVKF